MFQHFGQRLKRDLKQLVDRRLDASVTASGSVLKVSPDPDLVIVRLELMSSCSHLVLMSMLSHTNANAMQSGLEVHSSHHS